MPSRGEKDVFPSPLKGEAGAQLKIGYSIPASGIYVEPLEGLGASLEFTRRLLQSYFSTA